MALDLYRVAQAEHGCCDQHGDGCIDGAEPCCRRCPERPNSVGGSLADVFGYLEIAAGKRRNSADYRRLYLQSPHWRSRRLVALQKVDWTCEGCGKRSRRLDVHHLSYDRLGEELDEDLQVLCRDCHNEEHPD